ncbi:MAG: diaminopimelate epimerase [Mariprofundales bacterium]|nr:diaminopimelate epimerase [Mariprofundales bacterium]
MPNRPRTIAFTKMEAQGNDFIIIDGRNQPLPEFDSNTIRQWCDRRLGIGCDQLLLLLPHPEANAGMRIFNNDGSEAQHCGNGARCVGELLMRDQHHDKVTIALANRTIQALRHHDHIVVEMGSATIDACNTHHTDVNIGNPHRVYFDTCEQLDPTRNIEIITGQVDDHLWIDIIERGAGRTPACGSGACAVAAAWWQHHGEITPLTIVMPGGEVQVSGTPEAVRLSGTVRTVFQGKIAIPLYHGKVATA